MRLLRFMRNRFFCAHYVFALIACYATYAFLSFIRIRVARVFALCAFLLCMRICVVCVFPFIAVHAY